MSRKQKKQLRKQKHNYREYKNRKSLAKVQSKRIDNYSKIIEEVLEKYSDEIGEVVGTYNKKSFGKTMALRLIRTSTQNTQNRKTHQEMVEALAVEAAKRLGLNVGTVRIMAKNHDIGHTPFGHGGEWWITDIEQELGLGCTVHNATGPKELIYRHRIYDEIIQRIKEFNPEITDKECGRIRKSLWLIFDGINSHNGELSESEFIPNTGKTEEDFKEEIMRCHIEKGFDRTIMPATIEGCLIRMCDKIAYTPFDMVDGLYEGIMENIKGEHKKILMTLGITEEEIDIANSRKSYEKIARKLQVTFLKSVIENSSKSAIKMDERMAKLMHALRSANNREIVNLEVLQEDQEIYPEVIKKMMYQFADIIEQDIGFDELRQISYADNPSYQDIEYVMKRYRGTPDENFVNFIMGNTREIYEFNEKMIRRASERSDNGKEISFERKMALEFGLEYISTLNDFEFLKLIEQKGLITDEQSKSLHRKYKDIGRESLIKESYMQDAWKEIFKEQEKLQQEMRNRR